MASSGVGAMNASGAPMNWSAGSGVTTGDGVYPDTIFSHKPASLSGNVLRIAGAMRTEKTYTQMFSCMGKKNDVFVLGGWAASKTRPRASGAEYHLELFARPKAEDVGVTSGTPSFRTVGVAEWSEEWSDWQFASNVIVMPWRYTALGVRIWYTDTLNTAEFTGLFLHQERFGRSFQYDGKGNVLSAENLAALKSGATYDAFNNLLTYKQPGRDEQYAMTYGSTDAQITPHFVFNTLESISWKVMEKIPGDREISAMIHALAQFLRMNLRVNTPLTSVHDELEHAKLYIFIQQMRFKNQFQVTWDMERGRFAGSSYTPCDKADCRKRPL